MDAIIGRIFEKNELEEAYSSKKAELIAVYGRRRIGKTYLIKNCFQPKKCIYFQTVGIYQGLMKDQLARFSKELGETFYHGATLKPFNTWIEAFDELTKAINLLPKTKKIILFFDELPWLASRKAGILSALEYFWNRYWTNDPRLKIIVCGSSASWIIRKIIKNRGGLHNRVTRKLRVLPFNLAETHLYLEYLGYSCNLQQTLRLYMLMGGVPFYLNNFKKNRSIDQNINQLFFNKTSLFFNEFDEIFLSLFNNAEQYKIILTLIAQHRNGLPRHRITEESNHLIPKGGRLTQQLQDLEDAGFIASYRPFAHKKLGVYYRINDEYCYFYLKWIAPIKETLQQDDITHYWKRVISTPDYFSWLGYTFENICFKHLALIKKALNIDDTALSSPWSYRPRQGSPEKGAQIDLLFDREDNAITLCEIKYGEELFTIDKKYAEVLNQRVNIFKEKTRTKKQIFLAMITATGLKQTMYSEDMIQGTVTLNDLFK
jgi:AAA+ ATPase superfamily predicted ATPase